MTTFRKMFWTFDPIQGSSVFKKGRIFAFMVFYASFPLIWYATWLLSAKKKWTFDPTPGAKGVCKGKLFARVL